jgi:nitrogen fixation/metabolism regulation signal transduction histidine kinase
MASRRSLSLATALIWRAGLIGLLAAGIVAAVVWGFYITSVVLIGLTVLAGLDLRRRARTAEEAFALFIDHLDAEGAEWPATGPAGLPNLAAAMERAKARLVGRHAEARARLDHLQALIDSVAAALLAVGGDGKLMPLNRAARRVCGPDQSLRGLSNALGAEAEQQIGALTAGASVIVRLASGGSWLATCTGFSTPGQSRQRLVALQRVAGDLDAVQLKSWQDLARVLSHELMNSLTPICSLAESSARRLRQGVADAEVDDALDTIVRRSAGLMDFVERYRRIAELPAPVSAPIAVRDLAAAVDRLMANLMAQASVDYASEVLPPDLTILGDAVLLEQALINLLKNGLEAAQARPGGRVRLSFTRYDDRLWVTVADNGGGLSTQALEALFVPFFTTKRGGSGIGLNLARQIAHSHGGGLDYEPGKDGETVFRLSLPLGGPLHEPHRAGRDD